MTVWPDRRILDLFGIDLPILQAPMAGATTPQMVIAVCEAGGLGSLPCAMLSHNQTRTALDIIRQATGKPINVNFFCHQPPADDPARLQAWRARLAPYYREFGLDADAPLPTTGRAPFDDSFCQLVEQYKPEVVSFHFGLPERSLLDRVKATGAKVIASATTAEEAVWLEQRGCDAIIAMGLEAGGHRGNFLSHDMSQQIGLFALLPQVVDAVKLPVIAAGGIADARGIVAAMALGAAAVQIGTAYLLSPEATIAPYHRAALKSVPSDATALTNLFTGRPARGIMNRLMREQGPLSPDAPAFPTAGAALAPIRSKLEPTGNGDFSNQWSGQAARLAPELPAGELTRKLAAEALAKLGRGQA
ncbi:MAG: nitronate monooxygenase [Ferrovibrio sp.]|uniref:NAD(P)H-dependent flavin oxidoreductase n=1 Tax=Ferrovibrio sp. TaxID=1917215 RepID=UPI002633CED2|nr:nitronate monooxygenase [Ferrovibrio sp.]MCW0234054.1 nitronate monooxygenase [Ferrovibrio sp.]